MNSLEFRLNEKVFQIVKNDILIKIQSINRSEIIQNTDQVIDQMKLENTYEPIEVDWTSFRVVKSTMDYFTVDNTLLGQGHFPTDRIVGNIFTFSSTILNGNKDLLDFFSENVKKKQRHGLYDLQIDGKTISFSIVIFGNSEDALIVAKRRDEIKDHLKKAIDDLNKKSSEFKRAIDELIILETNMLKKRYTDAENLFNGINGIH